MLDTADRKIDSDQEPVDQEFRETVDILANMAVNRNCSVDELDINSDLPGLEQEKLREAIQQRVAELRGAQDRESGDVTGGMMAGESSGGIEV